MEIRYSFIAAREDIIQTLVMNEGVDYKEASHWCDVVLSTARLCTSITASHSIHQIDRVVDVLLDEVRSGPPLEVMFANHLQIMLGQIKENIEELKAFVESGQSEDR